MTNIPENATTLMAADGMTVSIYRQDAQVVLTCCNRDGNRTTWNMNPFGATEIAIAILRHAQMEPPC